MGNPAIATSMQAIVCKAFGFPHSLHLEQVARPKLSEDEVRIRVITAGINFPDSLIIKGEYQIKPSVPFIPGFEASGQVTEVGARVSTITVGQRVMGLASGGYGAFAEEVTAHVNDTVVIPDSMDFASATALFVAYGTAYHGLVQRGGLQPGETLVVLGASGGVGLAAVELGKALGAYVIAVCRTKDRAEAARAKGADCVISYEEEDIRERVLEITGERGADVCIDMLGGQPFHAMSRTMNWNGRLLIVGFTSGSIPQLAVNLPLLKGYQVMGVYWGKFMARFPQLNAENFEALAQLILNAKIKPTIAGRYCLSDVPKGLASLLSREVSGKIIVDVAQR